MNSNRDIVMSAFIQWERGEGRIFDLLVPEATTTLPGSGIFAGTWHSVAEFDDEVERPFMTQLSTPIKIALKGLYADGDVVVARFESEAMTRLGDHHRNSYAWFFTMRNGKAVELVAYLDLPMFEAASQARHLP